MSVAAFALPPLQAFSSVGLLFLQACLLHPSVPASVSRPLRFVLMLPTVFFAAIAPFWWRIEPVRDSVPSNFRAAIFPPYILQKAIEWGLARDRTRYQWVGFEAQGDAKLNQTDASPKLVPANVDSSKSVHEQATMADTSELQHTTSFLHVLGFGFQLLASMRGVGRAYSPPAKAFGPARPQDERKFFWVAVANLMRAHVISNICIILMVHRDDLPRLMHAAMPIIDQARFVPLASIIAYLSVGFSLYFQMCMGFEGGAILWLLGTNFLRRVLPSHLAPPPFDSRQFPPLFNRPFEMTDITGFWALRWHSLFRQPFLAVGYEPTLRYLRPVIGKNGAKAIGALTVFALSAWMHDYALMTARYGLAPSVLPPVSSLSFTERWGAWIFFLSQAGASFVEVVFRATTGRKVGGALGRIWAMSFIFGLGCLAARSWLALGFAHGMPRVEDWGWQRWILPSASLAPAPLYIRHR